jgi:recombination protein RecT
MATAQTPARAADFPSMLQAARDQIAAVLPEHVSPDRVIRVARTAWQMDNNLRNCDPRSILACVMKACELGLEPSGALKHCYLVPFKGEATLILGYAGILELARRTGQYLIIDSRVVYANDEFRIEYTPDPVFRHVPALDDPGIPVRVYAFARLKGGELALELMSRAEVEAIRKRLPERAANSGPWRDYWGEKARNVVLKRLLKRMPLSVELAQAVADDNEAEWGEAATVESRVAAPTASKADAIAGRLAGRAALPGPDEDYRETPHDLVDAESSDLDAPEGREPGSDDE